MKLQVKSTKTEQTLQLEVEKNNALQTELQASSEIQTMCNEKEAALRKELEILSAKHAKCDRKISHLRTSLTRSGAVHSRCEAKISGLEEELRLSKDNARAEKTKMLSELHKMRRTQNLFGRAQEEERQAQEDRLRAEVEEHIKEAQSSASKWEIKFSESQKQVGLLQEKLKQQQLDFVNDGNKAAVMWEERAIDRQIKNRDLRKENQDMVRVIGKLQRRIHALVDASSDQGKGNTRGSATIRTQGAQPPVAYESSLFDLATHMSDINKQMK